MKRIRKDSFLYELTSLSLPVILQMLVSQVLQLTDNIMVGSLGEECISAVSICGTFLWLIYTFLNGTIAGTVIICSKEYGKGNIDKIKRLFSLTLTINIVISLIAFLLVTLFPEAIIQIYSNVSEIVPYAKQYLSIVRFSIIVGGISTTMILILNSLKDVKMNFICTLCSCAANVFFNWIFIYGNLGMPKLGIYGAAIGTAMARVIELLVISYYFFFKEKVLCFRLSDFSFHVSKYELHEFINVALPMILINMLSNLISSAQTIIMGHISKYYISANSIVHSSWTIPNALCYGVGFASSLMIGNLLGKKEYDKAKEYSRKLIVTSVLFGILNAILLKILLPFVSASYDVSPQTIELAEKMGNLAAITVVFISIDFSTFEGILKATGNTKRLLMIDIIANWVIAIPLGVFCAFVLRIEAQYLYLILRLGKIIEAIYAVIVINKFKWLYE